MNTSEKGNLGEAKVLAKFIQMNIPVYLPFGDGNKADMIVLVNNTPLKIQIKTSNTVNPNGSVSWRITHQDKDKKTRIRYTKDEVDYFALYSINLDILCLIPIEKCKALICTLYPNHKDVSKNFNTYSFENLLRV